MIVVHESQNGFFHDHNYQFSGVKHPVGWCYRAILWEYHRPYENHHESESWICLNIGTKNFQKLQHVHDKKSIDPPKRCWAYEPFFSIFETYHIPNGPCQNISRAQSSCLPNDSLNPRGHKDVIADILPGPLGLFNPKHPKTTNQAS